MVLKHFLVFILYCLAFVENQRVPALSKFYNKVQVDNELNHMLEAVISDQESTTADSSTTEYYDPEVDTSIENFLTDAMQNYKQWLAIQDPLSPISEVVVLDSKDLREDQMPEMDVVMKISNQYMANHSKYEHATFPEESNINNKILQVYRIMAEDFNNVTFGGEYNVSGTLNVSSTLQINFGGEGKWYIKGNRIRESLFYVLYTISKDGYVDLASTEYKAFTYSATWNEWDFEGLEIHYNGVPNSEWEQMIKQGLQKIYSLYLNTGFGLNTNPPPKQLLDTYLQDRFMSTKLVDIVSDWQTMPTTSTTTSTTTLSPSQGHRNTVHCYSWIIVLTLFTLYSVV